MKKKLLDVNNVNIIQQFNVIIVLMDFISMELVVHYVQVIFQDAQYVILLHVFHVTVDIIYLLITNANCVKMVNRIVIFVNSIILLQKFNVLLVIKDIFLIQL